MWITALLNAKWSTVIHEIRGLEESNHNLFSGNVLLQYLLVRTEKTHYTTHVQGKQFPDV
jgi:hypothetical protein